MLAIDTNVLVRLIARDDPAQAKAAEAAIAKGAGIPNVALVTTPMDFVGAVADAFERNELTVVVAKVEAVGPDHFGMDLKLPENAFRFERYIKERKAAQVH